MIAPKFRLIFWTGAICLPCSILATTGVLTAVLCACSVIVLCLLAIADAVLAVRSLEGISVELPELVRFSKGREGLIRLRINNDRLKIKQIRLGLQFPIEIHSPKKDIVAELPEESQSSSLTWPCTAVKQGKYFIENCFMEVSSPLNFWAAQTRTPAHSEIRVYPDLLSERKNIAALFLNQRLGIHTQQQIGKGLDFDHLREYVPGDNFEDIHWKATARRAHPVTKVFQIERTQRVYVIMDASRLSTRNTEPIPLEFAKDVDTSAASQTIIMDKFVSAALIMGLAAERQGDLFGILTFSDRVQGFLPAKSGKTHYNACREMLSTSQTQSVSPDFAELFTFIGMRIRRRSLLIFLINLDDPVLAENFIRTIDIISKKHLVLIAMLKPAGARPLFSSSVKSINDLYRNLGGHIQWDNLRETEKFLKRHGIGFTLLDNEKMSAQLVSQYLNVKQRQIL